MKTDLSHAIGRLHNQSSAGGPKLTYQQVWAQLTKDFIVPYEQKVGQEFRKIMNARVLTPQQIEERRLAIEERREGGYTSTLRVLQDVDDIVATANPGELAALPAPKRHKKTPEQLASKKLDIKLDWCSLRRGVTFGEAAKCEKFTKWVKYRSSSLTGRLAEFWDYFRNL